jgi:predicted nucleic acid-binding protein
MSAPQSWLLDCCTVIHLGVAEGDNHDTAMRWVEAHIGDHFVLCSVSEGALLRYLPRKPTTHALQEAWVTLDDIYALPGFEFLNAPDLSYRNVANKGLQGVKQITDAWLAQLARRENLCLATFDKGLVAQHPDIARLIS